MADAPFNATPTAVAAAPQPKAAPMARTRDSLRETAETIVFVVCLVLMLKLFVVEAFVIPTGSMAETLYGYQKIAECPECAYRFPVNAANEAQPSEGGRMMVVGACCPNCRHRFTWFPPTHLPYRSGDRVLVHKALYHLEPPERGDVVVFKYPVDPQLRWEAQNYIKRLCGLGGETIGISRGDLYRTTALKYDPGELGADGKPLYPRPADPAALWERGPNLGYPVSKTVPPYEPVGPDYTYHNAAAAVELFDRSRAGGFAEPTAGFELIRKSDSLLMAMRRIVYDNEHQSKTAAALGLPPRWGSDSADWTSDNPAMPKVFAHAGDALSWVRYRHLSTDPASDEIKAALQNGQKPADAFPPGPITNFMGYNSEQDAPLDRFGRPLDSPAARFPRETTEFWVGDLILECSAAFQTPDARLVLELSKGEHRYQAEFAGGKVRLLRTGPQGKVLAIRSSPISGTGTHSVRFANVDCRLRLWVDETPIDFGTEADYPPDAVPTKFEDADHMHEGWTVKNDVDAPASIGASGGVQVSRLALWRDTYYTTFGDGNTRESGVAGYADTYFVHPGHYLCLGDNSAQSQDSRTWGTVPERLMLGKAVFVFWPSPIFAPLGDFHGSDNRIGLIR